MGKTCWRVRFFAAVLPLSACTGEVQTTDAPETPIATFDGSTASDSGPTDAAVEDVGGEDATDARTSDSATAPTGDAGVDDVGDASSLPVNDSGGLVARPPTGCSVDDTVTCQGGGEGWSCAPGDNPEAEVSGFSCSVPEADPNTGNDDFCCIDFTASSSTCVPVDTSITGLTCAFGSYEYRCAAGDDPTSLDASLACSAGVADPDGTDTDFCCQ